MKRNILDLIDNAKPGFAGYAPLPERNGFLSIDRRESGKVHPLTFVASGEERPKPRSVMYSEAMS